MSKTVLIIHGGVGVLSAETMHAEKQTRHDYEQALLRSLQAGYRALTVGQGTSVDAVEAAIRVLEDEEFFNAGRGSSFNSDGRIECDAAIMEGNMVGQGEGKRDPRKRAGAIAGVCHLRNPISAARAVMEMEAGRHVFLIGEGAEAFALEEPTRSRYRIERVSNLYFWTDHRRRQIEAAYRGSKPKPEDRFSTVGAVALDQHGHLAAGTSTGGMTNKLPGRVGDSPLIGSGTYADDRACGVSCTGTGEIFIRHAVAHDVVARLLYGKQPIDVAVREAIDALPDEPGGLGGLIALDHEGRHAFAVTQNSAGMYRGYVTEDGQMHVAIYTEEGPS